MNKYMKLINEKTRDDLQKDRKSLEVEIRDLKIGIKMGDAQNTSLLGQKRRELARINTVLNNSQVDQTEADKKENK